MPGTDDIAVNDVRLTMAEVAGIAYEQFNSIGTALTLGKIDDLTATATAIAWAESGGNARAHNTNSATGDDSYGLWQINMLGGMGPRRRALFGISSNDKLFDPRTNASAMLKLWMNKGRQFTDWSTYKSGAYKKHLDAAKVATKNREAFAEGQGKVNTTNFVTEALDAMFNTVFGFLREAGLRTAGFVGGAALLIGALVLVAKKGVK